MDVLEDSGRWPQACTVAVIADTHADAQAAQLPHALREALTDSDLILHAGDIGSPTVLEALEETASVIAVKGNTAGDNEGALAELPRHRILEIGGRKIALTHGNLRPDKHHHGEREAHPAWEAFTDQLDRNIIRKAVGPLILARLAMRFGGEVDCVVFGHTHVPIARELGSTLYVNPGDAQYSTKSQASVALLEIPPRQPIGVKLLTLDLSPSADPDPLNASAR